MNKPAFVFLIPVLSLLILSGCESDRSPLNTGKSDFRESGEITFSVTFAPWKPLAAKAVAVEKIDKATAYAYTDEKLAGSQDLELINGRAKGHLVVPAQDSVRVALGFLDDKIVRYLGESFVDVPSRSGVTVNITEHYLGTTVIAPDSAYVGKDYRLRWMKRPFARWYEVQESKSPDFTEAWGIYTDTDTTCVVAAKNIYNSKINFYYRARVWTDYGPGPWHGQGVTGIAGDEGTVIIDVPVPPDTPAGKPTAYGAP
ncbi:MAG: hypothetical protein ACYC9O_15380 [Candidatus Latescibacterota bacterium]